MERPAQNQDVRYKYSQSHLLYESTPCPDAAPTRAIQAIGPILACARDRAAYIYSLSLCLLSNCAEFAPEEVDGRANAFCQTDERFPLQQMFRFFRTEIGAGDVFSMRRSMGDLDLIADHL